MKFYHLTNKDNIESILKYGILPKCGENTSMVEKNIGDYIFLTSKKDLEIWSLFLNRHYVVEVELKYRPKRRSYSNEYAEYYTETSIEPNCIISHYEFNPIKLTKYTRDLLVSYMEYMSFVCDDYLDCDPTSRKLTSIQDRTIAANTLKVFATNPIYFKKYLKNSKELYKTIFGGYVELLSNNVKKEVNKDIKSKVTFFLDYFKECC